MTTTAQREAEYGDTLGRCEVCGHYVPEDELHKSSKTLHCDDCCAPEE